ncbi:MAG: HTTM domain-containing protein [Myxococcales bacterium]|nr:HTTM domain-containing protein [Myxococcales bacterium]
MAKKRRKARRTRQAQSQALAAEAEATPTGAKGEPSAIGQAPTPASMAPPVAPPANRRLANAFILLFLAYQVLMPLRYYLGEGGYDERFSWRMFSTLRLQRCSIAVTEQGGDSQDLGPRPVDLKSELHVAWINILKRYRPAVVEKFMRSRCRQADVSSVGYLRNCVDTDGATLPPLELKLDCDSGRVQTLGGES